ncbi:hydrogenase expression/formation protein HypE [Xenococcus sp. PCC 7305]|uniref:hydrogenase expression/formation protein HypE n=1 Tax=Xenococcus sp. PCC 7305 TaxID=102125 RepID=UPI0002ABA2FB|nr:hydrogenase expression/formation protein HypE [Xenococcus sp. PCC 7305]ELS00763.1 hydrogenase expression/formation protein HypE [Xenococcus sp. PCC 7305]
MNDHQNFNLTCPISLQKYPHILLAHGGGGRLMQQLIQMFLTAFGTANTIQHDAATLQLAGNKIAFTTDSYVVNPLFFPGGDIGSLAVNGTVNDLAMSGARPLYLSTSFILEEGLSIETLWQIVQSMQQAAVIAKVQIVTGDTKVVDKGKGDGIFINTTGVGIIEHNQAISPQSVQPGDLLLLNGDLARHGIAIMAVREGLEFETTIESDSAPLADLVLELLAADIEIHCLRDLTRGGLASVLNEIAAAAQVGIEIDENSILVREDVQGACEIVGFDPLYVANEGRFVAFIPQKDRDRALDIMRSHFDNNAEIIGQVVRDNNSLVVLKSKIGSRRIVDMQSGEQLPRIC